MADELEESDRKLLSINTMPALGVKLIVSQACPKVPQHLTKLNKLTYVKPGSKNKIAILQKMNLPVRTRMPLGDNTTPPAPQVFSPTRSKRSVDDIRSNFSDFYDVASEDWDKQEANSQSVGCSGNIVTEPIRSTKI